MYPLFPLVLSKAEVKEEERHRTERKIQITKKVTTTATTVPSQRTEVKITKVQESGMSRQDYELFTGFANVIKSERNLKVKKVRD